MTFKKQLPGLYAVLNSYQRQLLDKNFVVEVWSVDVERHTLDKQRVREAIKNCVTGRDYYKALKELGL